MARRLHRQNDAFSASLELEASFTPDGAKPMRSPEPANANGMSSIPVAARFTPIAGLQPVTPLQNRENAKSAALAAVEDAILVRPRRPQPPPPPPRALPIALVLPGILLAASLLGLMIFRGSVVERLPKLAPFYEALQLPAGRRQPLAIAGVTASLTTIDGRDVLLVEGDIRNTSQVQARLPQLSLTIQDQSGATLYNWQAPGQALELEAGAASRFRARLVSPPPNGRIVSVRFAETDRKTKRKDTPLVRPPRSS